MKRFVCLLLSALMLTACTVSDTDSPSDSSASDQPPVETTVVEEELDPSKSYITGNYTKVDGETIQQYPRLTNLPTLYIDLDDGLSLYDVQHGIYSSATYTFVDSHIDTSYYELPLEIKGRGNYSWGFAQKPYTIRLGDSADFMGMGSAKKWVLVTLSSDKSMLHNYLTQKLAANLGLVGTVENEYVDVVVNGSYAGTYVLTESIQLHESRLNIPGDEGILFEIEKVYRHTCDLCIDLYTDPNYNGIGDNHSMHIELKEYQGLELDEMDAALRAKAQRELDSFFANVEAAMKSGDFEALEELIDVDSFINWYLLNEFTGNYDSSFTSSVYCYINEQGKLCMGPCWDYDTAYGIQFTNGIYTSFVRNTPWYSWLFDNCPEFVERLQNRWAELREEDGIIDQFIASIDPTIKSIELSEQMQHNLYPHSEQYDVPYDEAVDYFKYFISERVLWMDWEYLPVN